MRSCNDRGAPPFRKWLDPVVRICSTQDRRSLRYRRLGWRVGWVRGRRFFLRRRGEAAQNAGLRPKQVIAIIGNIVHSRRVGSISFETFVPLPQKCYGPRPHDGDASQWADISLTSHLNRTIFDHDVGPKKRYIMFQVCLRFKTKDCSGRGLNYDLPVILREYFETTRSVAVWKAAAGYLIQRSRRRDRVSKNRAFTILTFFPAAPGQIARVGKSIMHQIENRAECAIDD